MERTLILEEVYRMNEIMGIQTPKFVILENPSGGYGLIRQFFVDEGPSVVVKWAKRDLQKALERDLNGLMTTHGGNWSRAVSSLSENDLLDLMSKMKFNKIAKEMCNGKIPGLAYPQRKVFYENLTNNLLKSGNPGKTYSKLKESIINNGKNLQTITQQPGDPIYVRLDKDVNIIFADGWDTYLAENYPETWKKVNKSEPVVKITRINFADMTPAQKTTWIRNFWSKHDLLIPGLRSIVNTFIQTANKHFVGVDRQIEEIFELIASVAEQRENFVTWSDMETEFNKIHAKIMSLSGWNGPIDTNEVMLKIRHVLETSSDLTPEMIDEIMEEMEKTSPWNVSYYESSNPTILGKILDETTTAQLMRKVWTRMGFKNKVLAIIRRLRYFGTTGNFKNFIEWREFIQKYGPYKGAGLMWGFGWMAAKIGLPFYIGIWSMIKNTTMAFFTNPSTPGEWINPFTEFKNAFWESFKEGFSLEPGHGGFDDWLPSWTNKIITYVQEVVPLHFLWDDFIQEGLNLKIYIQNIIDKLRGKAESEAKVLQEKMEKLKNEWESWTDDKKNSKYGFKIWCQYNGYTFVSFCETCTPKNGNAQDKNGVTNNYVYDSNKDTFIIPGPQPIEPEPPQPPKPNADGIDGTKQGFINWCNKTKKSPSPNLDNLWSDKDQWGYDSDNNPYVFDATNTQWVPAD